MSGQPSHQVVPHDDSAGPNCDVEAQELSLHPTAAEARSGANEAAHDVVGRIVGTGTRHDVEATVEGVRSAPTAIGWARLRCWADSAVADLPHLATLSSASQGQPPAPSFREGRDCKVRGLKHFGLSQAASRQRQTHPPVGSLHSRRSVIDGGGGSSTSVFSLPPQSVEELEAKARKSVASHPVQLVALNLLAAVKVMVYFLVTLETVLSSLVTAGMVCYWYFTYQNDAKWNGGMLDFILLAFAVVSPISVAIGMAYNRRERALLALGDFRSCAYHLYLAHVTWNWPENGGRAGAVGVNWVEHGDAVLAQLVGLGDELSRLLSLPTATRSRHRMTRTGRLEAARLLEVSYHLVESMCTQRMTRLLLLSERLKKIGLPSGEASRLRQYERFISYNIEQLRLIKLYRTPEALRSFARIFTLVLPPFYAPAYAQVARSTHSLAVGISFGILTALGLSALFQGLEILEDPFTAYLALDGIDVREELEILHFAQLVSTRQLVFPNAQRRYPPRRRPVLTRPRSVHPQAEPTDTLWEDPELGLALTINTVPAELNLPVTEPSRFDVPMSASSSYFDEDGDSLRGAEIHEPQDGSTLTSSSSSDDAWAERKVRIASQSVPPMST